MGYVGGKLLLSCAVFGLFSGVILSEDAFATQDLNLQGAVVRCKAGQDSYVFAFRERLGTDPAFRTEVTKNGALLRCVEHSGKPACIAFADQEGDPWQLWMDIPGSELMIASMVTQSNPQIVASVLTHGPIGEALNKPVQCSLSLGQHFRIGK